MTVQKIILAGGCFWGMEELIRSQPGITETRVGYTGGNFDNPTYKDMTTGKTGHAESVEITYDTDKTTLSDILQFFFKIHDPTTVNRQGNDTGTQYRSAIYYTDEDQYPVAIDLIKTMDASGKWPGKIVTEVKPAGAFYLAESYHQDYLQKNPGGYTCHWVRPNWAL